MMMRILVNIKPKKIYKKSNEGKTNWKSYLKYIIKSYRNYKLYLARTKCSNYEYIWDLICSPKSENGVLFERGINLIILKREFDSMLDKISVICQNQYIQRMFFMMNAQHYYYIHKTMCLN